MHRSLWLPPRIRTELILTTPHQPAAPRDGPQPRCTSCIDDSPSLILLDRVCSPRSTSWIARYPGAGRAVDEFTACLLAGLPQRGPASMTSDLSVSSAADGEWWWRCMPPINATRLETMNQNTESSEDLDFLLPAFSPISRLRSSPNESISFPLVTGNSTGPVACETGDLRL